jgi:hypothetical protein
MPQAFPQRFDQLEALVDVKFFDFDRWSGHTVDHTRDWTVAPIQESDVHVE